MCPSSFILRWAKASNSGSNDTVRRAAISSVFEVFGLMLGKNHTEYEKKQQNVKLGIDPSRVFSYFRIVRMKKAPRKTTAKRTISLPAKLLRAALERSKQEHRSLSSYIQFLIARDAEKSASAENFAPQI